MKPMPAKNASKHTSTAKTLLSTTMHRFGRLLGLTRLAFGFVQCCGGLFATTATARSKRSHASGSNSTFFKSGFAMTQGTLHRLDTPLAHELAEHLVLKHDMDRSLSTMRLWQAKYISRPPDTEDGIIGRSLFRDAIIQFVGCFGSNPKISLQPEQVYPSENGQKFYAWFKNMRDAYAAHKFGAQRQCVVGVTIHPVHGPALGTLSAMYVGAKREDAPKIVSFMETGSAFLDAKVKELNDSLLLQVTAMSADQITSLPIAQVSTLADGESRLTRRARHIRRSKGAVSVQAWTMDFAEESAVRIISHTPSEGGDKS
jgi:hypothetical protein